MKQKRLIPVIIMLFLVLAHSQDLNLGGYCENNLSFTFADTGYFADNAALRMELTASTDAYALEAHAILKAALQPLDPQAGLRKGSKMDSLFMQLFGATMESLDSSSLAIIQALGSGSILHYFPYSSFYPRESVLLDRALAKLYFKHTDLYIGRQQIAWGTGYAFNPSDIWNMKDPLDAKAPKTGTNAVRVEIPLGNLSNLNLIGIPGPDIKHSRAGVRLKTNFGGYDMSLSASRLMNADREILSLPAKVIGGLDFAGQLGEVGIWAEGVIVNPKYDQLGYSDFDSAYIQADAGLDYTFENGFYMLMEYYHNGRGESDPEKYDPFDIFFLMGGDMAGLAKNYLMVGARKNILDKIDANLFAMGNVDDGSAVLMPAADYYWSDEVGIRFGATLALGNSEKTELGSMHNTASMKATVYF